MKCISIAAFVLAASTTPVAAFAAPADGASGTSYCERVIITTSDGTETTERCWTNADGSS